MARRLVPVLIGLVLVAGLGFAVLHVVRQPVGVSSAGKAEAGVVYQCAMHPQIIRDEPGNCPICGMRLVRRDKAELELADADAAAARAVTPHVHDDPVAAATPHVHDDAGEPAATPHLHGETPPAAPPAAVPAAVPGRAPFVLTPERQQLIGVKRGAVERRALELEVRAPGRIAYDPALYQALVEYREAVRAQGGHIGSEAMVRAARLKLRQQGLSESLMRDLAASANDPVELLLPGASAWVYAQVFEHEAPLVQPGQAVRITSQSYPGRTFKGRVVGVDPILDATTRTVRVRALVSTDGATLRPESLVDVRIASPLGDKLAVPRDAVLDSGEHRIVFVVRGSGSFAPREVQLGRAAGDWVEVLSGLDAGEQVVTSANFLIDSESKIRAALAAFQGPGQGGATGTTSAPAPAAAAGAHVH
ncbi:efflux RND transporter periplasmic adaptor subunit [Candidatus Binatia bacterium]|nr:efflux RND transporter periplasmic adaptor subunit [Candidatus Binatia bacterium]